MKDNKGFKGGTGIQDGSKIAKTVQAQYARLSKDGNFVQIAGKLQGGVWDNRHESSKQVFDPDGISQTILAGGGGGIEPKIVLGWTRDEKGNVIDRHPVEVANAVTSAKRDNTQNYVVEHE